jgi:energy-coupling factor transporter transmembrane protein EcfT
MDLRAFGVQKRTWLPQLKYRPLDWAVTLFGFLLVAAGIVIKTAGYGGLWVPPFLIN